MTRRPLMTVQHRVPDEIARRIFQRLNQEGTLTVILDVLRDHRDTLVKRIEHAYIHLLVTTDEQRAELYARHGAASERNATFFPVRSDAIDFFVFL